MIGTIRSALRVLTPAERRRSVVVLALAIVNAVLETTSVVSVFPFIAVLGRPQIVQESRHLGRVYDFFGFTSTTEFLIAIGITVLVLAVITAALRMLGDFAMIRFTSMRRHSVANLLFKRYMAQRSLFFMQRNSSDIMQTVITEVDQFVNLTIRPSVQLISSGFAAVLILGLLIIVDVRLVGIVLVVLGGTYLAFFAILRRRIRELATRRDLGNHARYRALSEALGGIREVKLLGLEREFLARFSKASFEFSLSQAESQWLGQLPRHFVQTLALAGIVLTGIYFVVSGSEVGRTLPVMALFAVASYRLMPAIQLVYAAMTNIGYGAGIVATIERDLALLPAEPLPARTSERLALDDAIVLDDVTFAYDKSRRPAIHNVNFRIAANTTVAFVGSTGAGKTTAADLIAALLEPTGGSIRVDGTELTAANRREWQNNVGYVSQQVYLLDDTIANNIAFGSPNPDMAAVRAAARLAQIDDFIIGELPNGYDALIGERGVRLSGGQRQRLGIARALYRDPGVLVFDEATSHLDNATEQSIVQALASLTGRKTIIVVAHRLSTVRVCERIFVFDQGTVVAEGTYESLKVSSPEFRSIEGSVMQEASAPVDMGADG